MVLTYYYDIMSQPCRSLYMFLEINKIPYQSKLVALRKGEHRNEEFAKINPFKKVPVIDDDGFILTESIAIMEYLCQKYGLSDHWYPRDLKGRARVEEYNHWHHTFTRNHAASLFRELLLTGDPNPQEVEKLERYVKKVVQHLDTYYLRDHDFLCGNEISISDLLCICELTQLNAVGKEYLYMDNAKVGKWVERVKRACGTSFDESHKLINRVRDSYLKRQKTASKM